MSAISLQRKLDNAHKKVANILGFDYTLYRPLNNTNVIHDSNIIASVKASTTLNDSYTSTIDWGLPVWTIYTFASMVQQGDFLYSEKENRTFFILSRLPHLPVLALEVPDRIDVQVVSYSDNNGFSPAPSTYIARNLPCYLSMGTTQFGGGSPGRSVGSTGIRNLKIFTTFPQPQNLLGATISTGDFRCSKRRHCCGASAYPSIGWRSIDGASQQKARNGSQPN